jgi:ubiquinone/menaquinone biosynthesis C-methylase UbiE
MFNAESYQKHKQFIDNFADDKYLTDLFDENNPIFHYNNTFFQNLDPLIIKNESWLTVGDFSGIDAAYIKRNGAVTTATDLTTTKLEKVLSKGLIDACEVQNVEALTYDNNSFDYVCCKEAYHHFPRPAIGFYEMLRVAKKGVVILEPNDINLAFPPLMFVRNILDKINTNLLKKIWRNQYSYEVVGNFVYKISFREFEKMTVALDMPVIACKGFNSAMSARWQSKGIQNFKKAIIDIFCKLSLIPYQHLSIVVLKTIPSDNQRTALLKSGYKIYDLPKNPYN